MPVFILVVILVLVITGIRIASNAGGTRIKVKPQTRKEYYQEYLKSEAWQRKRYVVLRRDNWRCVYCGAKATQVHHKRYAKYNIGKEPIGWLVSVCKPCHVSEHQKPLDNDDWYSENSITTLYRLLKPGRRRWR